MAEATAEKLSAVLAGDLAHLLDSSMKKIRNCLAQIDDEQVWWRPQASMNSIGNLMLHLAGNLRINRWRERDDVQLIIQDAAPATGSELA